MSKNETKIHNMKCFSKATEKKLNKYPWQQNLVNMSVLCAEISMQTLQYIKPQYLAELPGTGSYKSLFLFSISLHPLANRMQNLDRSS